MRGPLFGCLAFASLACAPERVREAGPAAWREDLAFLAHELPARHVEAFHTASATVFAAEVRKLDSEISNLTDDQVIVGLMRLVALIGDGHTHLDLPPSAQRYPLELAWFGGELRVVAAPASDTAALGARVNQIGNVSIDSLMVLVSRLVPRGENNARTRLTATMLLTSPQVLHGLGLSQSNRETKIGLVTNSGATSTHVMTATDLREIPDWRIASNRSPLWLRRLGETWWAEPLPEADAVYLSFSQYPPREDFERRVNDVAKMLDESDARRIVVDLRRNGGGDFTLVRRYLIPMLEARRTSNRAVDVYAVIGPGTFSAAMVNAVDFKVKLGATLVGEPTGARPNSYSEHGDFRLPNSGLRVSHSTRYYRFGADSADAVYPDQRIEPTWEDFRAGRDPVMEWILRQPSG